MNASLYNFAQHLARFAIFFFYLTHYHTYYVSIQAQHRLCRHHRFSQEKNECQALVKKDLIALDLIDMTLNVPGKTDS